LKKLNLRNKFCLFFYICLLSILNYIFIKKEGKIIISLTSDYENINKTQIIINSIFQQRVNKDLFEIILILPFTEFSRIEELSKDIIILQKQKKIKIIFVKKRITYLGRTLITMKKFKNNPIIIVNNNCQLPDGWLEMFIKDHSKYPNDAIAANIQYFFCKNGQIKEFSEGFRGEKFGIFNHVTEMVFNFALFNIDLGGIIFPKNFFQNPKFYEYDLFSKSVNISEEFWESAFIMIEDKILRQSSKIFDFTKYLINNINYEQFNRNKIKIFEKNKILFMKVFPNFISTINKRQKKLIVSITSYPKRFKYLPDLMTFIRNQNFQINKIIFFLYKGDMKYYDLNIKDVKIILSDKNLRPHLKYFYAMKLFKDYAIITLDDDIGYTKDTFESLFNSYIQNPNVISGRRSHLMTYKKNGELKGYFKWKFEQNFIKETNFNLTLTNVGGSIFPPDILNINDGFLPIIKETITCDDLTLKYFANIKGIPPKWIVNNKFMGIKRKLPKTNSISLFKINHINNDLCINKLNIMINKLTLKNLCVQYRDLPTGNSIYLFDIHNKNIINNIIYFDINAYSYCPIDYQIKFDIYFQSKNHMATCFFNESRNSIKKKSSNIISCSANNTKINLDYYFPFAKSENNLIINIYNYRKYLSHIFKEFDCQKNNCLLKVIILYNIYSRNFTTTINDKQYSCKIDENYALSTNLFPCIKNYICTFSNYLKNDFQQIISGIPINTIKRKNISKNNVIPKQFIIHRIVVVKDINKKGLVIIGKVVENLQKKLFNFTINLFYPKITLECTLKPNSKYVQSKIYCFNDMDINSQILIENQITNSLYMEDELLLINEETFIKFELNKYYNS